MTRSHAHWPEDRADGVTVCGTCGEPWNGRPDPTDLCHCGHDGYDGHDMRTSPPECYSCGCGHPAPGPRRYAIAHRDTPGALARAAFMLDLRRAVGSLAFTADVVAGRATLPELLAGSAPGDVQLWLPLDDDGARSLVRRIREAYSACGAHDRRDDDCPACVELPDLNRPDLEAPDPETPPDWPGPLYGWHDDLTRARESALYGAILRQANADRRARARILGSPLVYSRAGLYGLVPPLPLDGWDIARQTELAAVGASWSTMAAAARELATTGSEPRAYWVADGVSEGFELSAGGRWAGARRPATYAPER